MPAVADRIRLTFDVPERVRRALNVAAARKGDSVGDVIEWLAEQLLAQDLEIADRAIAEEESGGGRKGRRRPAGD